MHRDQKVGLALAILLVGVVGAFFFRNETKSTDEVPKLKNPKLLDDQIAEMPYTPYLTGVETNKAEGTTTVEVKTGGFTTGTVVDTSPQHSAAPKSPQVGQFFQPPDDGWELPDFLKEPIATNPSDSIKTIKKSISVPAPDPIPLSAETVRVPEKIEIPKHNNAWDTAGLPVKTTQTKSNNRPNASTTKPVTHLVQKGETLSGIAARHLGSSARFREIFEANRDKLANPDSLKVGMKLRIPQADQQSASTEGSDSKSDKPNPDPAPSATKRRFQPVKRSPFQPGPIGRRTSQLDKDAKPLKSLSQVPPPTVPSLEDEVELPSPAEEETETP